MGKGGYMFNNVLTYGTFDVFHYGHLNVLKKAKEYGDRLIVGVSTDGFNKLKNKKAYQSLEKRIDFLSGIKYVDLIIKEESWEQKTSDIEKYNVKTLIMGDDWEGKFDDLPCNVIYIPRTKDISSTAIRNILK